MVPYHVDTEAHWGHSFLNDLWLVRFRNRIVPFRYQIRFRYRIPFPFEFFFYIEILFDIEFDSHLWLTIERMHAFAVFTGKYIRPYRCTSTNFTTTVNYANPKTAMQNEIIGKNIFPC